MVSDENRSESRAHSSMGARDRAQRFTAIPSRIALIYLVFGICWIFLFDRMLLWMDISAQQLARAQTLMGCAFVVGSALLIRWLLRRYQRRDQRNFEKLLDTRAEVERMNAALEARVAERTQQLEFANREMESFAYAVSHDLRAPLRSMSGFSQLLLETAPDSLDDKSKHYLQRILESGQRMSSLIDDLLNLSRIGRSDFVSRTTDLSQIATDIVTALRERYAPRDVAVEVAPGLKVEGDTRLLRIALENLLDNAWKYTSTTQTPQITVGTQQSDKGRVFFVRDNGVGFDMQYAGKLFAPFQRLHPDSEFPGTGIGLVTVQRIVARHGGHIWAEASPGSGACFYFTLNPATGPAESVERN